MSINLKHLQAFVSVAEQRSFRRAAERLNTTQPNISTRVAALETRLGASLMDRDAGSVRLSPIGQRLLPYARRVLGAIDDLMVAAQNDALFEGVMRLGVTEMIANTWLGTFLKALNERFPNVLAELTVDVSANLSNALFDRSLDLALQSGPFDRQIEGQVDLGSYPLVWVASPVLGLPDGALSLDEITTHPILAHARGTRPYEQLALHIRDARASRARLVSSSNMAACLQMAVDGIGITCMPEAMVMNEIASGRLVRLSYSWTPDPLTFAGRYHAETSAPYVAQAAAMAATISREQRERIK